MEREERRRRHRRLLYLLNRRLRQGRIRRIVENDRPRAQRADGAVQETGRRRIGAARPLTARAGGDAGYNLRIPAEFTATPATSKRAPRTSLLMPTKARAG